MDAQHGEDDNQQIAEAMVQLSGFYGGQPHDESMDVDPNYDPSDFLGNLREKKPQLDINIAQYEQMNTYQAAASVAEAGTGDAEDVDRKPAAIIHDDLAISDSDEDGAGDFQEVKPETSVAGENTSEMMAIIPPVELTKAETKDPDNRDDDDADNDLLWF